MKSYSELIEPGSPLRLSLGGRLLYVQRSQGGPVLNVALKKGGNVQSIERVGKGFKAEPVGGFDALEISTTVAGVVDFVVTDGDIQIQFDEEKTKIDSTADDPVFVSFSQVVVPLGSVTVNNTNAGAVPVVQKTGTVFTVEQVTEVDTRGYLAAVVNDFNPAAVNAAGVLLFATAPARRGIRLRNTGANPVALGGAALTFANAVIVIQPGETWNENEAPGAEWHAICDAGAASTLNLQTIV